VTAAELLSVAAFDSGRHAQAFPTFGSERTGAPVVAYCRIDDVPIAFHEPIDQPNAVIVQDPTLLRSVPVLQGADETTYALVNTSRPLDRLGLDHEGVLSPERVAAVAATDMARQVLGRPLPNTALLGALCALTGVVPLEALLLAIRQRFSSAVGDGNVELAMRAHDEVSRHITAHEVAPHA
jgi:pyruvate ferredoxin oxidoreductase gamma subunit